MINSPNLQDFLKEEDANFTRTAEKPCGNEGKTVFFYSDGFKRSHFNDNLYIYNVDQANYQSLSKFRKKSEICENSKDEKNSENSEENSQNKFRDAKRNFEDLNEFHVEKDFYQGIPSKNNKFDAKISESAEFRIEESLNDREIDRNDEDLGIKEENERDCDEIEEDIEEKIVENNEFMRKSMVFKSFSGNILKKVGKIEFSETF